MYNSLRFLSTESWILIVILLALGRYFIHRKWQYFDNLGIPYPPPSISKLGHVLSLFRDSTAFEFENESKKKYGPIYGCFTFTTPSITVHDPNILRQILIKEFNNFPVREKFLVRNRGELNVGVDTAEKEKWKRIRSTMTPTFSTSKLKKMFVIMEWCVDNSIETINRKIQCHNGIFSAKNTFSRLSLDIVCSAAFTTNVHSQDDRMQEPEIAQHAKSIFSKPRLGTIFILCRLFPAFERLINRTEVTLLNKKALKYFKDLSNHVIKKRLEKRHTRRVDLMHLMLDSKISEKEAEQGAEKGMTENEIIGNSMLMILAGYEITGKTMSFTAYNLAKHPKIQAKVQEEIDDMYKERGKFEYEGVMGLKLLEMCIHETLRLYSPVIRNSRQCEKETTIDGFTFPKGILVNIPTFALSRDPEYWDEPNSFKPERMKDMSQIDPMVFQPFGGGPRNCIGMRFALSEIKMALAKLLYNFTFEPALNTPKTSLTLKMVLGLLSTDDYDLKAVSRIRKERMKI